MKTIKYVVNETRDCIFDIQNAEKLKSFKNKNLYQLLQYMKDNGCFSETDEIEVIYEEDLENAEKLRELLEVLE